MIEMVLGKATEMILETTELSYRELLEAIDLSSMKERKMKGDLITVFRFLI